MTTVYPSDPCEPPRAIARTVREVELNRLLTMALPYLITQQMTDSGDKLSELVAAIVRETA